jgi:2,3-bisphosphoglycerate-independent phosphoglycerate mutase
MLGLCCEHSCNVNTKFDSMESVDKVWTALFDSQDEDQKVCFGSDATVVGITPYGRIDHYSPIPIVASPSDKTEKGAALADWM